MPALPTPPGRFAALDDLLGDITHRGLARSLRPVQPTGATTALDEEGRALTVFCSNDYLGIAHDPAMQAAWTGAAAGSARLISGDRPAHHALEHALSERFGQPATLLSSGWHANLALLGTVLQQSDLVSSDIYNHASIIDGLRLTRCRRVILPHRSTAVPEDARLHCTETLFSMDGHTADLTELAAVIGERWLMVDEAHTVGALGPDGRGLAADNGVQPDFLVGTLGKAYGAYGAFVVGPPVLRDLLLSRGRAFIFTTGLPEAACHAALVGLRLATDARRDQLAANTARLRKALKDIGLSPLGAHHIVPIVLGPPTMDISQKLFQHGFLIPGIRPPTVPPGQERLRITVSAAHRPDQLDRLVDTLDLVLRHQP